MSKAQASLNLAVLLLALPLHAGPMVEFYRPQAFKPERLADVELTERWTLFFVQGLNIEQHARLLMCAWHRESNFDKALVEPGEGSYGITQVRQKYHAALRRFWRGQGIELGGASELRTQIAFGVAMFKFKLDEQNGNAYEAIRAYNGAGPGARWHRKKVIGTLRRVYGLDLDPYGRYTVWSQRSKT